MEDLHIANPKYSLSRNINFSTKNEAIFFTGSWNYIDKVKYDSLLLINKANFEF